MLETPAIAMAVAGMLAVGGWIFTTWLRVRNGYPFDSAWGQSVYPRKNAETEERVMLPGQENATDKGNRPERKIEALRDRTHGWKQ